MSDSPLHEYPALPGMACHLDTPRAGETVYAECLSISGWMHAPGRAVDGCRLRAWINDEPVGQTALLVVRPDVCAALHLPSDTPSGFRILAAASAQSGPARLRLTAAWRGEEVEYEIARGEVRLIPAQLSQRPYGDVVHPQQAKVLPRERIYGSGPPVEEPGAETLQLIKQHLVPGSSIVDVGCGAGAYGPALRAAGHDWLGLEINSACWSLLERRQLPFRKVEAARLPCTDAEFDDAICIEVLEHIAEPEVFLREIARVIRRRALFSVPNMEVIPYFSTWEVVPWHLLEGDHKNFFTRTSLAGLLRRHFAHVEVFSYAPHPLRTPEGVSLHLHLFAIADK